MKEIETIHSNPSISKNHGFSLIELVIVIVILALLSFVAAPKFIDISNSAELNILKQMKASMITARDQINLQAKLRPDQLNTNGNRYTLDNGQVIRFRAGYPDGRWNNTFRHLVDFNSTNQVKSDACEFDSVLWCVRQKNRNWFRSRGYVDGSARGRGFIITPKGYNLSNQKCYIYYFTPNQTPLPAVAEVPIIGEDFTEC